MRSGARKIMFWVILAAIVYICWTPIKGLLNQIKTKIAGATGGTTAAGTTSTGTGGSL